MCCAAAVTLMVRSLAGTGSANSLKVVGLRSLTDARTASMRTAGVPSSLAILTFKGSPLATPPGRLVEASAPKANFRVRVLASLLLTAVSRSWAVRAPLPENRTAGFWRL